MTRSARSALAALAFVLALALALAASASAAIRLAPPAAVDAAPAAALTNPLVATADFNRDGKLDAVSGDGGGTVRIALGSAGGLGPTTVAFTDANGAYALAAGDVTGDGKPDVLVSTDDGVAVHVGNGDGTFGDGYAAPGGGGWDDVARARSVELVDQTRDGTLDVVASRVAAGPSGAWGSASNLGDGTFASPSGLSIPGSGAPTTARVGDLNRDGKADIVLNDTTGAPHVTINGAPGVTDPIGFTARTDLRLADVDRDGILDLVGLDDAGGIASVTVTLGAGDGTFTPTTSSPLLSEGFRQLSLADLDRDGTLDAVVAGPDGVATLAGNGDGTFAAPVAQTTSTTTALALGDFDGDGIVEAAVLDHDGTAIQSMDNTTTVAAPNIRSVQPSLNTTRGPQNVASGDLNRDGIPDLVVSEYGEFRVGVYLGNGDGTFRGGVDYWPGGGGPLHPVIADMDRDGKPDIVVANNSSGSFSVMLGNGDGTFRAGADAKVTTLPFLFHPQGVAVGDFNNDGIPDAAISSDQDQGMVAIYPGVGDGTFGSATQVSPGGNFEDVVAADFNRDGNLDFAVPSYNNFRINVVLGNGDLTFQPRVQYYTGNVPLAMKTADVDRDGKVDILVANYGGPSISVLRGNGDGTFADHVDYAVPRPPHELAVGDFDMDGKLDVAVSPDDTDTGPYLLAGAGDGTFGAAQKTSLGSGVVNLYGLAVADLNRDGRDDLALVSNTLQKLYAMLSAVDSVAPVTTDSVPTTGWATQSPFRPTLTATDGGGGTVAATYYEVGSPPATPTVASPVYNPSNKPSMTTGQQISYFSVDSAGNREHEKISAVLQADGSRPSTSDDVPSTWRRAPVRVTLTASDTGGSGVDKTYYIIGTTGNPITSGTVYDPDNKPTLNNGQRIRYATRDVAGNVEMTRNSTNTARVDTAAPTVSDDVPASGWSTAPVTVTLSPADTGGSNVDKTYYTIGTDPADPTPASSVYDPGAKPALNDGEKIKYVTYDVAGNDSGIRSSAAARVDGAPPTTTDDVPSDPVGAPVPVTLTATDAGSSGVAHTYYEIGAAPAPTTSSPEYDPASKPMLGDGQRIGYFTVDVAGNAETPKTSGALRVDAEVPVTTDDVPAGWQPGPIEVTLTATTAGGSGVAHTYYEIGAGPAAPTDASDEYDPAHKPVLGDGERIAYFSVSGTGHEESPRTSSAAKVDTAPPTTTDDVPAAEVAGPTAVTLTADDRGQSGVAHTYYEVGATPAVPTPSSARYDPAHKPVLAAGERIAYLSADAVGNLEAPKLSAALKVGQAAAQPPPVAPPPALDPPDAVAAPPDDKPTRASAAGTLTLPGVTGTCKAGPCVAFGAIDVTLRGRRFTLGTAWFAVAAGKRSAVKVRLSAFGRRTLERHRRLRVVGTLRIYGPGVSGTDAVTRSFTLLAPKPKPKAKAKKR